MILFDKLKLICSLDVVQNISEQEFHTIVKDGITLIFCEGFDTSEKSICLM